MVLPTEIRDQKGSSLAKKGRVQRGFARKKVGPLKQKDLLTLSFPGLQSELSGSIFAIFLDIVLVRLEDKSCRNQHVLACRQIGYSKVVRKVDQWTIPTLAPDCWRVCFSRPPI